MNAIREYCDRAALINKSSIVKTGSSAEVAKLYTRMFNDDAQGVNGAMSGTKRWGNKAVTVDKIAVKSKISNDDKEVSVKIVATANKEIENPVFGIMVKNAAAEPILGTNTVIKKVKTGVFKTGQVIEMTWEIPKIFSDGYYYIDLAVVQSDLITVCDWWEESVKFRVLNDENTPYITSPDIRVRIG
jgi:hypothetical protein